MPRSGDHPIRRSRLLGAASPALLAVLDRVAADLRLAPGETLFRQGDPGDTLYVVEAGHVEIGTLSPEGRRVVLNLLGPGEVFGEIALFDAGARTATATASPSGPVTLIRIRRPDLFDELARDPALALEMIALAGRRLRWMSQRFEEQVFLSTGARLARRLIFLVDRTPGGADAVALSQSDLAEHVGVTREAVSKCLSAWRRAGWIEVERGQIRLLDRSALAREAEADLT